VADLIDGARFLYESLDGRGIFRQRQLENLDRDALADHRMRRRVHDAHAAAAELSLDDVATDIGADQTPAIFTSICVESRRSVRDRSPLVVRLHRSQF
jgi:hypothetical protein